MLLPVKLGAFLEPRNFAEIRARLYRIHLFGHVIMLMALVALGTIAPSPPTLVWPAVAVLGAASIVAALAQAFYYHFGAWGAMHMRGRPEAAIEQYVTSLRVGTEYATCLVRFGRVFFGLGQVVLALALLSALPLWLVVVTALLGAAAMTLTMAFPDNLEYSRPLLRLNAMWLGTLSIFAIA